MSESFDNNSQGLLLCSMFESSDNNSQSEMQLDKKSKEAKEDMIGVTDASSSSFEDMASSIEDNDAEDVDGC